jgi:YHS domain-containing protein
MPRPPARQQLETQQTIAPNNRFAASAQTAGRAEQMLSQSVNQPKSRSTPSLRGKCPVSLLQHGKWVDGNSKFGCIHRDRLYVFASAEKLATFRADPDLFSPVLAGYDPGVFHETGKLVEGQPEHGVFMGQAPDQRILLFTDAATRDRFQKQPAAYLNSVRQAMKASGDSSSMIR